MPHLETILSEKLELFKEGDKERNTNAKMPELHPGYKDSVINKKRICVHAEKGKFPEWLFKNIAPEQSDDELKYIKDNYKQITLPVFVDYLSTINRMWNDFSITYKEDADNFSDEGLRMYLEDLPVYGSLMTFMRDVFPSIKTKDAEGLIAIDVKIIRDEEGNAVDTELFQPFPVYYASENVWHHSSEMTLVLTSEKSTVIHHGRKQKKGLVLKAYDREKIIKITQVGKYIDYEFEITDEFTHDLGYVPVKKNGGVPVVREDGKLAHQSPFLYAVDNLDIAQINSSYLQISVRRTAFPIRVMVGNICEYEEDGELCRDGYIRFYDGDKEKLKQCPKCQGTGLENRLGTMRDLLLKPATLEAEGEMRMNNKPLEYISPDTDTLELLRDIIAEHENRGRKILHLQTTDTKVSGSEDMQTATAKAIDMKALIAFVQSVSEQVFDMYEFLIDTIGLIRYGDSYRKPDLHRPKQFNLETEEDLIVKISKAIEAGVPPFIVRSIIFKFINTAFNNDKNSEDIFKLIINTDRLITLTVEEVAIKSARNEIAKWESILHTSAITFIKELLRENKDFFEQDLEDQIEQLENKAKERAASIGTPEQDIIEEIAES